MKYITLLSLIIFAVAACHQPSPKPEAIDLKCEYLTNPIGISVTSPRLSWKIKKGENGAAQTTYRIMAATNEELLQGEKSDLWDSGKILSDSSIQITYKGKSLASGMNIKWKVMVWDEKCRSSDWSAVSTWEMGLLQPSDWQAKWIGAPPSMTTKEVKLPSPQFRKEVAIHKKIKKATVYISGLGYYELYLNGQKVGDHLLSPNQTNYDRRQVEKWNEGNIGNMTTTVLYETFDITASLKQGGNAFGITLGNGWYIQADRQEDTMLWYDTPRCIAQVVIDYEDGTKDLVITDKDWKCAQSPILYNGIHSGEIYDARLEQKGWNEPGFDDSKWPNAISVRLPTGKLKGQVSPPDRITEVIHPVSMTLRSKGVYRFDMGRQFSGWARLKISGPKGTSINMKFTEELGPTYSQSDTYILKGEGTEIWQPRFTWHAFRYVDVSGSTTELTKANIEGLVVNTDVSNAGTFECSNNLLNKILLNYQRTQLGNIHGGIPSDCPHRERRGYTGDGQISAKAAIYNFELSQFYTKWLNDIRDAQNHQTGYVPNTTPYQDGGGGTAWGSAYVIIPWYMYLYYGDVQILKEHYPGMKHWVEFLNGQLNKAGLLTNQGLGEWVPPAVVELPAEYVNTCYFYYNCRLMEKVAKALNNNSDQSYFADRADDLANTINKTYLQNDGKYSIGKQGANTFPLGFGLTERGKIDLVFNSLVHNVVNDNNIHFDTGILATPLLLGVLTELGRADLAYTLMAQRDFPGFGYMIEKGATTIWETWQGDCSHSHPMFGSACAWFYEYLGGIKADPDHAGFKHSIIKPYPVSSLSFVNTTYPSQYGEIKSNWEFTGQDYHLNVTIPANTTGTVYVLASDKGSVSVTGKADEVQFLRMEGNNAVYNIKSGIYNFFSKSAKNLLHHPPLTSPIIYPADTLVNQNDTVTIRISSDVPEANIHFTLDGSEPNNQSLVYKSPIKLTNTAIIKAKVFMEGVAPSTIKTTFVNYIDTRTNGLTYSYYEGVWKKLPDVQNLPIAKQGVIYKVSLDKIIPTKDEFALKLEGKILIEQDGDYEFCLMSNDGSKLFIDNKLIINNDGLHGAEADVPGKVRLTRGLHPIRLAYFQAGGGMFLKLSYAGPGFAKQEVPATVLFQK